MRSRIDEDLAHRIRRNERFVDGAASALERSFRASGALAREFGLFQQLERRPSQLALCLTRQLTVEVGGYHIPAFFSPVGAGAAVALGLEERAASKKPRQ